MPIVDSSRRLSSAPNSSDSKSNSAPRRALVLGGSEQRGPSARIAQQLQEAGFEVETLTESLPSLSDPLALDKLRAILARFADKCATLKSSGPPCLHPGVSVWAERVEVARLGEELGLDVICPPPRVLALFANKLNLLTEADRLGIPHLVTSFDPLYGTREIERLIFNHSLERKPFPFVLKSVKGGGSSGLFVVQEPEDLERKIPLWIEQVRRNLGDVEMFAERYLESARHIVVPFARHRDGRFQVFPMVDASLQCRYRKIAELCPAEGIGAETHRELELYAQKLASQCEYVGVGTFEFLVDASRAYLVEGTARLNTGYQLWENVAGTSAVAWQLSALEGGRPGEEPGFTPQPQWSSSLELRFYAEDPFLQLPQPGEVREVSEKTRWRFEGAGLNAAAELDLLVSSGSRIEFSDYGLLGILRVGAEDPKKVIQIARGALSEIWIAGAIQTNERFLSELLKHPWVQEGMFHAGFVDEEFLPSMRPPQDIFRAFQLVAAEASSHMESLPGQTINWAVGDQWVKPEATAAAKWVGAPVRWTRSPGLEGISGSVRMTDGRELRVCAYPLSAGKWQVRVDEWVMAVRRVERPARSQGAIKRPPRLLALVQGRVHAVLFRQGSVVPAHEPLLVLDSLGMLVPHAVPLDVRITQWKRGAEEVVQAGDELAELEILSKN